LRQPVLVNDKGDIIYITGRTGKYLEPVAGKANWNIHAMARDGLRKELPNAFQRALRSDEPIELRNIKIRNNNGDFNYATITIKQIESPDQLKGMVLIVLRRNERVYNHIFIANRKIKLTGIQKELESELAIKRRFAELTRTNASLAGRAVNQ
jgi:two-component system CheB/CheR fusion protein